MSNQPKSITYVAEGGPEASLGEQDIRALLAKAFAALAARSGGKPRKVLALPPDITRFHSRAGMITGMCLDHFGGALTDIMPALGTHAAMRADELDEMFPGVPHDLFRVHRWRDDLVTLGTVPASYVEEVSGGRVSYAWPAQVNKLLVEGGFDLILSIGQVVPHEVVGMANHNKNIFVGTGGSEGIHKSHFLGAAYGMERMMGEADTPVRRVLDYAEEHFGADLPLLYILTVVSPDKAGKLHTRGLFIGEGKDCFLRAAALAKEVNFTYLPKPLARAVVYLDPKEFRSTWLGNKAVYRTRMAMADGGNLLILAPGLKEFGEDPEIDRLIRKYGYRGTPATLAAVEANEELRNNLSAAAHFIHGSSEGRFSITYAPGHLSREEIEGAGFAYAELEPLLAKYSPETRLTGFYEDEDGEYFFISNPALGLWAADRTATSR